MVLFLKEIGSKSDALEEPLDLFDNVDLMSDAVAERLSAAQF